MSVTLGSLLFSEAIISLAAALPGQHVIYLQNFALEHNQLA